MKNSIWDKLEASFKGLKKDYPKGFTSREFAEASGCCVRIARDRMAALYAAGKIKCVGMRPIIRMDGKAGRIPVYNVALDSVRKARTVKK